VGVDSELAEDLEKTLEGRGRDAEENKACAVWENELLFLCVGESVASIGRVFAVGCCLP